MMTASRTGRSAEMLFDMHNHTLEGSFDGTAPARLMLEAAKAKGIDAFCVTDHDFVYPPGYLERIGDDIGIMVVPGLERTTELGHFLCFGIEALDDTRVTRLKEEYLLELETIGRKLIADGLSPEAILQIMHSIRADVLNRLEKKYGAVDLASGLPADTLSLIARVHALGGRVYWAHPMYPGRLLEELEAWCGRGLSADLIDFQGFLAHLRAWRPNISAVLEAIDGVEVASGFIQLRSNCHRLCEGLGKVLGKRMIGGSDAHRTMDVGVAGTNFVEQCNDWRDWLRKLPSGHSTVELFG